MKIVLFSIFVFSSLNVFSQTIIINEVSNGPSGNKEYIELIVADTTAFYSCGNTAPPCIDIRGWIIDDNSGYHGSGGIAAGANRFSQDLLWSCVPLGTIILIYNDADLNANIPAIDLSLNDGNCNIIAPITNTGLFETNTTTPGAIACSYPLTGWTPGGDWASTLLANSGDCARIVDLNGCEVFSLCWASCNTNNLIYFNSGLSGTDNVWYFNNGDPNDQNNWSEGCTDISSCGINEQTPGAPNNAANQNYIAQFNNNCQPITPINVTASSINAGCNCDGTAEANATGSIPSYDYVWYDSAFVNSIGNGFSINGLCAGTYHVIATSVIDCSDTATVVITSSGIIPVAIPNGISPVCEGDSIFLWADTISNATYQWSGPDNFSSSSQSAVIAGATMIQEGNYTLTVFSGQCVSDPVSIFIDISELPDLTASSNSPVCPGDTLFLFAVSNTATSVFWYGPNGFTSVSGDTEIANVDFVNSGIYTAVAELNNCYDSVEIVVNVVTPVNATIDSQNPICNNSGSVNLTALPAGGIWSGNGIVNSATGTFNPIASGSGLIEIIYSFTNSCISNDTLFLTVYDSPVANAGFDDTIFCNFSFYALNDINSAGIGLDYNWFEIFGNIYSGEQTYNPIISTPGFYQLTVTDTNGCQDSDTVEIDFIPGPAASFTVNPNSGYSPLQVSINDFSSGADLIYQWYSCEGDFSSDAAPEFILDSTGLCDIILIIEDENGCMDTAVNSIMVYPPYDVYIPNIFTPNQDNENDLFEISMNGVENFNLKIFNRWGQNLFQTVSLTDFWDGKYNQEPVPDGTYYYLLEITLPDLSLEQFSGFITLTR